MRDRIVLACSECNNRNYNSYKNKKNTTTKISLNKYCKFCKKHTLPMVINTHYWHLRDNPKISEWFIEFIQYAVSDGAVPSTISQCINDRQKGINRMGGN